MKKFIVFGAGGHGRSVAELILSNPRNRIMGYLDDCVNPGSLILDKYKVLGPMELFKSLKPHHYSAAIGVGGIWPLTFRSELFSQLLEEGLRLPPLIHPASTVFDETCIGEGSQIHPGAIVRAGAKIGRNCIVNSGAIIEHEAEIGDSCIISPGAIICGRVVIGSESFVGAGSTIIQDLKIGQFTFIAAGTLVTRSFDAYSFLKGVPAKTYKGA